MMMERTISVIKEIWLKKHPFQPREGERERARGDWFDEGIRSVTTVIKLTTKNIFQYVLLKHIIALISSAFWRSSFVELQKNLLVTVCHWSVKQIATPQTHAIGWASVAVVGLLKQTEQCFDNAKVFTLFKEINR